MVNHVLLLLLLTGQHLLSGSIHQTPRQKVHHAVLSTGSDSVVYRTDNLQIKQFSPHVYVHTSFLNTDTFGRVECNGMIVLNGMEAVIFDTPTDNKSSEELIRYLTDTRRITIKAIVPTHFHDDCVGGLEAFNAHTIPAYASAKTIALLKQNGKSYTRAINPFDSTLTLTVGGRKVYAEYVGEGHTKDNVTGYFPDDKALFGGCLIKEMDATKGYLGDANVGAWSQTVRALKQKHPDARIVVPGHGQPGGTELLDYTIKLFQ